MASDFEDLFADVGAGNLLDAHGESVTQYPLGNTANGVQLGGVIVDLSSQGETRVDDDRGSQNLRFGSLTLAAGVSVTVDERSHERDTFLVRGQIWHAEKIVSQDTALQVVRILRTEAASTKRTRV